MSHNNKYSIYGTHSVLGALEVSPKRISKIYIGPHSSETLTSILKLARESYVPVERIAHKDKFEKFILNIFNSPVRHQYVVAELDSFHYYDFKEIIKGDGLSKQVLILDHITDVSNFGAIIRSAVAFGIRDIIIPKNRSVQVNASAFKTSSGTIAKTRIIKTANLSSCIQKLKDEKFWIYAADGNAKKNIKDIDFSGSIALVIGAEGQGVSKGILNIVDDVFKIPISSCVESLNVSVAAAICLYHINCLSSRL